jgi:hypothetical protein
MRVGSKADVKCPSGGSTSTASPARNALTANVENAPSAISLMPTRNSPRSTRSRGVELIE